ncbi:MAG: transglycosylase domain-containing protein [Bacteriovorax sp.]|nr:transglycosylase domain-containing protein [Bacteriovorax sp.]
MKQWAFRILKVSIVGIILLIASGFAFVKWTIAETSLSLLEEKTQKHNDYFSTTSPQVLLEEGSVVKKDELLAFYLFSAERESPEGFFAQKKQGNMLYELKEVPGLLQVNQNIEIKNLLANDCTEIYCYQHYISFDYIPSIFWKGLIGVEDQRYLNHFGVDVKSIFRAFVTNIRKMRLEQGGSTISQQLVKNLFLTSEKTFSRKLKEMVMSVYIETKFPKEKILEAYLNEVYWGALQGVKIKGVLAASLFYFGKKPADITAYEGAILISLLKGPSYFSPLKKSERLKERSLVVYNKLIQENLIPNDLSLIWTDKNWENWLSKLKSLEKQQYYQSVWRTLHDSEPTLSNYEKYVLIQKVADVRSRINDKFTSVKEGKNSVNDISVKVMLGPLKGDSWYTYYSRIERNKEKAIYSERHQVGSTIKPIFYSFYEDFGKKLTDLVSTKEVQLKLLSGIWSPKEAHAIQEPEITLVEALLKSYNRPVIRIADEIGFEKIEEKLKPYFPSLKIPLREYPSQLLGSMELSVGELRDAYAHFLKDECQKIKSGERSQEASVLYALSDPNLTTVENAVDAVMQKLRFFGKTGTTNNGYDNWYVAFDGKNLSLIWVGYEGERKTKSLGLYGATTAFNVFQNYYRDRGKRFQQFGCELTN